MKRSFHIAEGQCWHFGNVVAPGQYGDHFLPLRITNNLDLLSDLKFERQTLLEGIDNPDLDVLPPHFKTEAGGVVIRLKWKPQQLDDGRIVIVDKDNNPLTHTDREMQDAFFKVSFYQTAWEYKGKCGTKLIPRKIQLQSLATLADVFNEDATPTPVSGDF